MHACTRTSWHGERIHAGSLNEQGVPRTTVTTAPTHLSRPYTSHVHVQCSAIMVPRGCDLFYMLDSRARARAIGRVAGTNMLRYQPAYATTPHGKPRIEITFLRYAVPFCFRSRDRERASRISGIISPSFFSPSSKGNVIRSFLLLFYNYRIFSPLLPNIDRI